MLCMWSALLVFFTDFLLSFRFVVFLTFFGSVMLASLCQCWLKHPEGLSHSQQRRNDGACAFHFEFPCGVPSCVITVCTDKHKRMF